MSFDIGYALSKYINDDTFVIGHDARLSSESLFNAFSSGIMSNGKKIKYIGLVPTDVVYTMSGLLNITSNEEQMRAKIIEGIEAGAEVQHRAIVDASLTGAEFY